MQQPQEVSLRAHEQEIAELLIGTWGGPARCYATGEAGVLEPCKSQRSLAAVLADTFAQEGVVGLPHLSCGIIVEKWEEGVAFAASYS